MSTMPATRTLVVEREMAHPLEKIWRALTQSALMEEWLMKNDFQPVVGHTFHFRVPDRGSGNPTPLGGMGPTPARCTLGHGELQTRQPYGLGLQVPHCMGYKISVPHPWGRCGGAVPRAGARDGARARDGHSCRVDQS